MGSGTDKLRSFRPARAGGNYGPPSRKSTEPRQNREKAKENQASLSLIHRGANVILEASHGGPANPTFSRFAVASDLGPRESCRRRRAARGRGHGRLDERAEWRRAGRHPDRLSAADLHRRRAGGRG